MELSKNQIYEAVIHGCSSEGHGVCRLEGRAVFVPGALEGERWLVRIVKVSSAAVWGRGEELLEGSQDQKELLSAIDILIDGPFLLDEKSLEIAFRGSRNQRILDVKKSLAEGKAVETASKRWLGEY